MKLSSDISAVVTGGASGLGEATARYFAAKGVKVGIFDFNAERGAQVAKEIGGVFAHVNVADNDMVDAGFETLRKANGQERILVNAAGIGLGMKTVSRKRDTGEILAHDVAAFKRMCSSRTVLATRKNLRSSPPLWWSKPISTPNMCVRMRVPACRLDK